MRTSLSQIFQKKLIRWILAPGLLMTLGVVAIVGLNQMIILERELVQLSRSLSQNVDFFMDGSEDLLDSVAFMSGKDLRHGHDVFFTELYERFSRFDRLIMLDENENIIAVAPQGIKGVDFPIRFNETDQDGHILTSPVISPHSGNLVVFISQSVPEGGRIVAELRLAALQQFIYGFLSKDRIVILTDPYGNLIVHPDQDLVEMQSNIGSLDVYKGGEFFDQAGFYTANGKLYFGTVSQVPGTGWKLLVACTAQYIFQPFITFGVLSGLLLTGLFIILLFALRKEFQKSVVSPIHSYLHKLSSIAKGVYPNEKTEESEFIELYEFGMVFDQMARNVHEREQELRVAKMFFQSVIDSMPSALIWIDDTLMVRQCNRKALEIFGDGAAEITPRSLDAFFGGDRELADTVAQARRSTVTLERRKVFGDEVTLYDFTIYPLVNTELEGVVVRLDDVTSRTQMEEIMVQTEKMISVGGLAAGMAHEINNPLGSIMQGAQNLTRRFSPELAGNIRAAQEVGCDMESLQRYLDARKVSRIIDGIRESGARAANIVANMLEFSRPGKSERTIVGVEELIDSVVELAAKDYDLKKNYDFQHIEVVRELAADLPEITCSRTEIEQVLFNLMKNAAQAMSEHGVSGREPKIVIRAEKNDTGVSIEVEDNGPGMDLETSRRVFEPFYTTKPVGVGTGLGLSVSYFIITQNHGGTLSVESHPGQWTRFTMVLPC